MPYDARAIGNWFIDRATAHGENLTPMKLQKLVYISHGWHLGLFDAPLIHDAVEAWKFGPVIRSLYREFRDFGADPITRRATVIDGSTLDEREISIDDYAQGENVGQAKLFLDRIWEVYSPFTAGQLSDMTHRDGTPWHTMYRKMGNRILPYTVIPNDIIKEYYQQLANGQRAAEARA